LAQDPGMILDLYLFFWEIAMSKEVIGTNFLTAHWPSKTLDSPGQKSKTQRS
jgi:hypothetical protein